MSQAHAITPARADRRLPLRLQVKLEGEDLKGRHFSQFATTVDISRSGARLSSLQETVPMNSVVDVQYGADRARCQVVWQGRTPEESGQIGIRCLDEDHVPWSHLLANASANPPQEPSQQDSSPVRPVAQSEDAGWPDRDRRRAPRFACNTLATIQRQGDSFSMSARLTDVSLTGGYLETMAPLPIGTEIRCTLETPRGKIPLTAVVRTMHPAMGNGIAFTKIDVEALDLLQGFLLTIGAPPPGAAAGSSAAASGQADSGVPVTLDRQVEALVQLLEEKAILKRDDLLRVLKNNGSKSSV